MNIFQTAALALILTVPFAQAEPAGVSDLSIEAPHHGRPLTGTLFTLPRAAAVRSFMQTTLFSKASLPSKMHRSPTGPIRWF